VSEKRKKLKDRKKAHRKDRKRLSRERAVYLAWKRGFLRYKLYSYQVELYLLLWTAIHNPECLKYVLNCSRRWGKSTILCLIAIEFALKKPGAQIRFAAPTAKALKKITQPIMKMLIRDAPLEFRPKYKAAEQMWVFPNGSEIHMAGTDNGNYESLRGTASDLNIVDEAGFADELEYILSSVLMPQTLTTGGTTLLASTPPKSPSHDFYSIAQEAEAAGFYRTYTIYDNKSLTPEIIALYAKESGGFESTTWKREYLCQFVVDEESMIIPEMRDNYVEEWAKDEFNGFYHRYVAMDMGVKDFTALLLGYYDFIAAKLVIEDEITMNGHEMTTEKIAKALKAKELLTFGKLKPYRRIADNNNPLLVQDLGYLHQVHFNATDKDDLGAMVNELRIFVGQGKLRIHPRCKMLIGCLKYGIWDDKRRKFAKSKVYRHFDHLAALVYLVRNLDKATNPIPPMQGYSEHTHYVAPIKDKQSQASEALQKLFKRK